MATEMTATVLRFPLERASPPGTRAPSGAGASVVILPSVRIERLDDTAPRDAESTRGGGRGQGGGRRRGGRS